MKARLFLKRHAAALLLLAALGPPQSSHAQTVQGQLLDRDTGLPVEGALVLLLTPELQGRGGALTGADGRFAARTPGPGFYLLRVYRIGYETTTSDVLKLSEDQVVDVELQTKTSPIQLAELRVEGERRCVVRPEEGQELARAWEEASKALTVQDWAESQELYEFRAVRFRRNMDDEGTLILSEDREIVEGVAANPVRSLPAEELVERGFIQIAEEEGRFDYFGPDASALLSDPFLDTHCLRFQTDPDFPDIIGLSFVPVRDQRPPDIEGTLWLDRETARPLFLEFVFDWAPWAEVEGVARGRVEFRELPSGVWIIPRWWLRMPTVGQVVPLASDEPATFHLIGTFEVGWELIQVTTLDHRTLTPGPAGTVRGQVRGSSSPPSLSEATILLREPSFSAPAGTGGDFLIDGVPEGGHGISLRYPFLDSLGVSLRGREFFVQGGKTTSVRLEVPARDRILETLCKAPMRDGPSGFVTGTVLNIETGDPAAGAAVFLQWAEKDFWIFRSRRWTEVESDESGRFWACGFPAGVRVKVQAADHPLKSRIGEFRALPGGIVIMDLHVGGQIDRRPTP